MRKENKDKKYLQRYFMFRIIESENWVSIEPLWNGNYSREQKPEARSPGSIELKWIAIQKARKD